MFKVNTSHEHSKEKQGETYQELLPQIQSIMDSILGDPTNLITPFWLEKITQLSWDWKGFIPWDFTKHHVISWTMFTGWNDYNTTELEWLKTQIPKQDLINLITESAIGDPAVIGGAYRTSGNTVHHAYHLTKFAKETGCDLASVGTVVEWGGGYGNVAKLMKRINICVAYVIVDIKCFAVLQWIYLSAILGKHNVNLITPDNPTIKPGIINIIALGLLDTIKDLKADLFLSTWALSESPKTCHDWLQQHNYFGARYYLTAHQGACGAFPLADQLTKTVKEIPGATIYSQEIEHLPGNFYTFAVLPKPKEESVSEDCHDSCNECPDIEQEAAEMDEQAAANEEREVPESAQ